VHLAPNTPFLIQVPLPNGASPPGQLGVQLEDKDGATLLEYTKAITP